MTKDRIRLSVIIATKNRPDKFLSCIQKLLAHITKEKEIIILDQSDDVKTYEAIAKLHNHSIFYYKKKFKGKSAALNFGIKHARGDIIAFTDDDCIVSNNWMKETLITFDKYPDIACITGNTYPYDGIPAWACLPIISTEYNTFSKPEYHVKIGFGNNYAIRKSVLKSIGYFKTWLGPGSVCAACEDGEMVLRILTCGYKILHNPKMIIYHNKKLNKSTLKTQDLLYLCGEMACYGYYSLSGYQFARSIIKNNWVDSYYDLKRIVRDVIRKKTINTTDWKYFFLKLQKRMKGFVVGLFYFIKEAA